MRRVNFIIILSVLSSIVPSLFGQRYAMVGDSITAGHNAQSWVEVLRANLLSGVEIENDGIGGATLSRQGDFPYADQPPFTWATNYDADVVVIMLGTNDAKWYNWISREHFEAEYRALIDYFLELPSSPRVVITTPIPVLGEGDFGIQASIMNGEIVPAIRSLASYRGVEFIDVHGQFGVDSELYLELIHPSDAGAVKIAKIIGRELDIYDESASVVLVDSGTGTETSTDSDPDTDGEVRPMPRLIAEAKDIGDGWRHMDGLGDYYIGGESWLYHNEMGWVYNASDDPDDLWIWKPSEGWLWTARGVYPYTYSTSRENWIVIR